MEEVKGILGNIQFSKSGKSISLSIDQGTFYLFTNNINAVKSLNNALVYAKYYISQNGFNIIIELYVVGEKENVLVYKDKTLLTDSISKVVGKNISETKSTDPYKGYNELFYLRGIYFMLKDIHNKLVVEKKTEVKEEVV